MILNINLNQRKTEKSVCLRWILQLRVDQKNDATCFVVMQLIPATNNQYIRNVVYVTTLDGGHTFDQALKARRLFDDFECDYIIVDTNGVGIGVYDNLVN